MAGRNFDGLSTPADLSGHHLDTLTSMK